MSFKINQIAQESRDQGIIDRRDSRYDQTINRFQQQCDEKYGGSMWRARLPKAAREALAKYEGQLDGRHLMDARLKKYVIQHLNTSQPTQHSESPAELMAVESENDIELTEESLDELEKAAGQDGPPSPVDDIRPNAGRARCWMAMAFAVAGLSAAMSVYISMNKNI